MTVHNDSISTQSKGGFDSAEWQTSQQSSLDLAAKGVLPRSSSIIEFLSDKSIQNIIDFGGGPGWIWVYLVKRNLHGNFKYFNLELESSRLVFEYLTKELPNMKFLDMNQISALDSENNLLYCNSVL